MRASLLLALAVSPLPATPGVSQDDVQVRVADELYPALREDEVVRFLFVKTDEPDLAEMNAALEELGAKVVYGPRTTEGRPGRAFFAVQAPWDVPSKKLERAARKAGGVAEELDCIAFEGRDDADTRIKVGPLGFTSRDFVLGMSGEIVWFDSVGGWSQFYGLPGKLEADEIAERYAKLYGPYGGGRLGRLVRERFTWTLAEAPDERRGKKLLKAIGKLDGVHEAWLVGGALTVEVALEGLLACRPAGSVGAGVEADGALDGAGLGAPRAAFSTRPLWELLADEGLTPARRADDDPR